MIKKRNSILSVFVAMLMAFAMIPMTAGTVFAEDNAPVIDPSSITVKMPEGQDYICLGDSAEVSVKVTDDSEVTSVRIIFKGPDNWYRWPYLEKKDGDIWSVDFDVLDTTPPAVWKIRYIEATDDEGNVSKLFNTDIAAYETPNADLTAGNLNILKWCSVTFNSRGGSDVEAQKVLMGKKAAEPEAPTREGWDFGGWYSDEDLSEKYDFSKPVEDDFDLYGSWWTGMAVGVYNESNPDVYPYNRGCGTIDIEGAMKEGCYQDQTTINFAEAEGPVTFTAKPAEGYLFKGWYEGQVGDSGFVEGPKGEMLSADPEYKCNAGDAAVCASFECAGHQWEQKIQKATPTDEGKIYQQCSVCGTEEIGVPLPKVSKISLEGTSFTYTGKKIEPEVTVANAGEPLSADCYTVTYSNNINAGTATAKVTLKGDYYEGSKSLTFKINKAANPLAVKAKPAKVKFSKLKKTKQTLKAGKVITFTKKGQGKMSYKLAGVSKKKFKKYFSVNAKTGKVTVKKKLKKGTYKVKIKVKAKGDANYKASAWKAVTIKIKVR